jgi:hypothetical protein
MQSDKKHLLKEQLISIQIAFSMKFQKIPKRIKNMVTKTNQLNGA